MPPLRNRSMYTCLCACYYSYRHSDNRTHAELSNLGYSTSGISGSTHSRQTLSGYPGCPSYFWTGIIFATCLQTVMLWRD